MPLAERMVQRPRHIIGQAFRPHLVIDGVLAAQRGIALEIFPQLGRTAVDFAAGTADVFGSLPDIVVESHNLPPRASRLPHMIRAPSHCG